jgi:uncharacterized damage-inducible protein DinB
MNSVELLQAQRKSFFDGTEMVIAGIKPAWFDLRPLPELMTFGEQVDHIAAVEAEILGETAEALKHAKIPYDFKPSKNLQDAIAQWKRIHKLGDDFIGKLNDEILSFRFLTVSHVHVSVAHMINVVLEHEIHHRGELVSYFRMIKKEPPKRWSD